jgi:colanic acid/amylovoran biosynthesis glycosyltransferase
MERQGSKMMNLAIVSPDKETFSESFIQAHRDLLPFNVHYYHSGNVPTYCEEKNLRDWKPYDRLIQIFTKLSGKTEQWHIYFLKKSLKKNKIKVVLCEYGTSGAKMWKICQDLKIPLIVHFHGYDASVRQVIEHNKTDYRDMFDYASAIISVSEVMSTKLISMGCPKEKIIYSPYGPRDEFFSVEPTYKSNLIISLGRFVDKKAPYYTIFAFKKALEKSPGMRLVMGGKGPLLNTCKNLVRFYRMEANVEFPGVLNRHEFIKYLQDSLAFVQHSIIADNGDMEGTPVAILEASAAGVPVISTYHAGIPGVIVHNETGFLVEEHDVNGMAERIVELIEDKEKAERLGSAGKLFIKNNFPISKHINTIKEAVEKALRVDS